MKNILVLWIATQEIYPIRTLITIIKRRAAPVVGFENQKSGDSLYIIHSELPLPYARATVILLYELILHTH
jgi:hypothetical protein